MIKTIDVAHFILDELKKAKRLDHYDIMCKIQDKYGNEFIDINENGNQIISKKVLTAFGKLKKEHNIEWDRGDKSWFIDF